MATTTDELNSHEAAEYIRTTAKYLYQSRYLARGPVSFKRNRRLVYLRQDLDAWLVRQRAKTLQGDGVKAAG